VIIPPDGSDTCFANMYAAYDALSATEKTEHHCLRVIHSWGAVAAEARSAGDTGGDCGRSADEPSAGARASRQWPQCLFMGVHASHFEGRPMAEGRERIAALEAYATQERFVYRHKWRAGDMLMWDNGCLLHRADANFDAAYHPRVLHRACLKGTAPA
jgi:taurine dioxygenase